MRLHERTFSRLLLVLLGLWCLGFSVGPVLEHAAFGSQMSGAFYQSICHQDPARSFSWFGASWGVCHRCSAIYISFTLAAGVALFLGRLSLTHLPRPAVLAVLLLPVAADGFADLVGLRQADLFSRLVTGLLTGSVLAIVVLPLLFDALRKLYVLSPSPSPGGHDARETT